MKRCPFCAEEIQDAAIKCRYCNEFLDKSHLPKSKWYFSTPAMVVALLSIGPFALPLVWLHPKYKRITKIVLTFGITALSIWSYFIARNLYLDLMRQLEELELY